MPVISIEVVKDTVSISVLFLQSNRISVLSSDLRLFHHRSRKSSPTSLNTGRSSTRDYAGTATRSTTTSSSTMCRSMEIALRLSAVAVGICSSASIDRSHWSL